MMRVRGFTLLEMLVAIGIVVLLAGILLVTVARTRDAAYSTDSANFIRSLSSAIERYHGDHRAYPGPLAASEIRRSGGTWPTAPFTAGSWTVDTTGSATYFTTAAPNSQRFTGAENLVLGLLGGLELNGSALRYDPQNVGQGPVSLNTAGVPRKYPPYIETKNLSWQKFGGLLTGKFGDPAASLTSANAGGADDSTIPEFVDNFPDPMPVLYLRARVGATSSANTSTDNPIITYVNPPPNHPGARAGQYDLNEIIGYTDSGIGAGREHTQHGLRTVTTAATLTGDGPYDAYPYFRNPNQPGIPRAKDSFILIGAGRDRTYGTRDDVTSFGSVAP